jgi:hypothetical protein
MRLRRHFELSLVKKAEARREIGESPRLPRAGQRGNVCGRPGLVVVLQEAGQLEFEIQPGAKMFAHGPGRPFAQPIVARLS